MYFSAYNLLFQIYTIFVRLSIHKMLTFYEYYIVGLIKLKEGYTMKTVIAHFENVDMADLAAKALKDKHLISHNINIEDTDNHSDGHADYDYFIMPLYSLSYSTPFVLPYFPGVVPFLDNNTLTREHEEDDSEQVIFAVKCKEENAATIQSILLSHSGYNIQLTDQ